MVSRKLEMNMCKCWSQTGSRQIYKTVLVGLSLKSEMKMERELECDVSAVGNDEDTQKIEKQEKITVTELELKSPLLIKTRAGRQ